MSISQPLRLPSVGLGLLSWLFLATGVYLGLLTYQTPEVIPADAPATVFSAQRALVPLRALTKEPHPVGSDGHARVRAYLLEALRELGLVPEVQTATGVRQPWRMAASVHNVMARLPGTASTQALLVMAHYDAAPFSYGASDNGGGVAAVLETIRALQAGEPLRNDVIFLFTDAEEQGLLGSEAFMAEHPWAREVGLVLNFEARGHKGPVLMFESTPNNGLLIEGLAQAASHPIAYSLSDEVYELLPNDTDLSVFKEAGVPGLNFAYIGGHTHYHTPLDTFASLDRASLQHHGTYMLALVQHFSGLDLDALEAPARVYFNVPLIGLVHYSTFWTWPLTLLALLGILLLVRTGLRQELLTRHHMLSGLMAYGLVFSIGPALTYGIWQVLQSIHPEYTWILQGDTYNNLWYVVGFSAFTLALVLGIYLHFLRRVHPLNLMIAPLCLWGLLALGATIWLPGATFIAHWPLAAALLGAALLITPPRSLLMQAALSGGLSAALIALLAPMMPFIIDGLSLDYLAAAMAFLALVLGLLIPLFHRMAHPNPWIGPVALLLAFAGCLVGGGLTSGFDDTHKKPNSILYALDADIQTAVWASVDPEVDAWTSQFLGPSPERRTLDAFKVWGADPYLQHDAPLLDVPAPTLEVLSDTTIDGLRHLRCRLRSPRRAHQLQVYYEAAANVERAALDGRLLADEAAPLNHIERLLTYYVPPEEGIEIDLALRSEAPICFTLVDLSYGLPAFPQIQIQPRPSHMMSKPFIPNEMTLVKRTVTL